MLPIICRNVLILKNFLGFKDEGNFERFLFRIFITESLKLLNLFWEATISVIQKAGLLTQI